MIRIFNKQLVAVENGAAKNVATVYCNSSDTKPTSNLVNGARLIEVDTGKNYLFNEATSSWVEVSGGGGGGVNNNTVETYTGTMSGLLDKMVLILENKYPEDADGWGSLNHDYLAGKVSGRIDFFMGDSHYGAALTTQTNGVMFVNGNNTLDAVFSIFAGVIEDRGVSTVYAIQNGVKSDMTSMLASVSYLLTLYWHEMPTN